MVTEKNSTRRLNPLEPASWTWFLRCPVCLDELTVAEDAHCHQCGRRFPIAHGIPYLSVVDKRWRDTLREIINYVYFYRKIMNRSVEKDRLESDAEHQRLTFEVMARALAESFNHIRFEKRPLIADIGAGMGETCQALAERGAIVVATDINCLDLQNPRLVTIGQPHGNLQDTLANARPIALDQIHFARVQCDSALLPLASGLFDVVFSRGTWHHYTHLETVLAECSRILKPGGLLVSCSEPLRAREDDEADYVAHVVDYQEGITEQAPTWDIYEKALHSAGFEGISVYGMHLVHGHTKARQLERWWNFWRRKEPGPSEGLVFSGHKLHQLHHLAGCINLTAQRRVSLETKLLNRPEVGEPILPTEALTDVPNQLPQINRAYRSVYPALLRTERIVCDVPVERVQALGLRNPERVEHPFSFGMRTVRFYLSGTGGYVKLKLVAVPGQSEAGMTLQVYTNDKHSGVIKVDWEGEKEVAFPIFQDPEPVAEIRLEHDRLWAGAFPDEAPVRELGVGFREVLRV